MAPETPRAVEALFGLPLLTVNLAVTSVLAIGARR
jgi:hypothetical protein